MYADGKLAAATFRPLVVPERRDGIQTGGTASGKPTRENADREEEEGDGRKDRWIVG